MTFYYSVVTDEAAMAIEIEQYSSIPSDEFIELGQFFESIDPTTVEEPDTEPAEDTEAEVPDVQEDEVPE